MRTFAALLAVALSGCSGGAAGLMPSSAPPAAPAASANANLRIRIPPRRRHAHYLSPATQSIAITITARGKTTHRNYDLTPATNPSCTPAPVDCSIKFLLPSGHVLFTFATYDRLLDGSGNPTGNELSANQSLPVVIKRGKVNAIRVTLEGLPSSVAVVPAENSTMTGNQTSGYTISKCFSTEGVSVFGVDADDDFILGAGAPAVTLSSSDASHVAVSAPSASSPNAFTLTRPNLPNPFTSLTLTATATPGTSGGGPPKSANVALTFNGDICGVGQLFGGLTGGTWGITNATNGSLWVTENNASANRIANVTTTGNVTEYLIPTANSDPQGIVVGPDGNLWFAEFNDYNIVPFTLPGPVWGANFTPTINSEPVSIVVGGDGALWFTEQLGDNIGRITTGGAFAEYAVPTIPGFPTTIAPGPDGALWFTEEFGNKIGRIDLAGHINEFKLPEANSGPAGIAAGPDGALWFTENPPNANRVGRITTSGAITEFSIPTASSYSYGIAPGPDGAMWFAESGSSKLGRIATTGVITETSLPGWYPMNVVTGADHTLWLTLGGYAAVGQVQ